MKKIYLIMIIVALVSLLSGVHENAGEYGFQVLGVNSSPAMAGMGDTGSLVVEDGLNFLANPTAGLFNKSKIVTASQNFWLFDNQMISGGYSENHRKYHFGVGFKQLSYGEIDERDETGAIIGEYTPIDFVGTLNFAYRIGATFYVGINTNFLYEKIHTASSYGVSGDLGYVWAMPIRDTKLYGTVKNIGSTSKMDKEEVDLAKTYEIGLSKEIFSRGYDVAFDAKLFKSDDTDLSYNFGVQLKTFEILYLRSGYKVNDDTNDLSYGIGIDYDSFNIDYAYLQMKDDIDAVHMVSVSYKF
ncbi:MAG: hypothetical protein B6226_01380 [Candidatus Cloacimonetes bacterium 4572_65]|nr:MAG: hypothetical protein B6226_01380 [Candidatus Cloacimonetes bacterium 4572_65]